MTKPLVLGAGGIVGQHMLVNRPDGGVFVKKTPFPLYHSCDLSLYPNVIDLLQARKPEVVVNLAGHNVVDFVDSGVFDDEDYRINVGLPTWLADWCDSENAHLIQVSTQGVFSGDKAPYGPSDEPHPITAYGSQKALAEKIVRHHHNWTIARVTFVLGVRPFAGLGRENPLEQMFGSDVQRQVNDRWFSPAIARDVADSLWQLADNPVPQRTVHIGLPERTNRYQIAKMATPLATVEAVSDDDFAGPRRPLDTTWAEPAMSGPRDLGGELVVQRLRYDGRENRDLLQRVIEMGLFFGMEPSEVTAKLSQGFHPLHAEVAKSFRNYSPNTQGPQGDIELLDWYKTTEAYIWELSAYHLDAGFNYSGMCEGILNKLTAEGKKDILILGDGIGDLSMTLKKAGLNAVYHDLEGSRTAQFAQFRHKLNLGDDAPATLWTDGWTPDFGIEEWDAIIALDFMEHLPEPEVSKWSAAVAKGLRLGAYFAAQNAFAIGDSEHGDSIPMHVSASNHYEHDWAPLMSSLGFTQTGDIWWRKADA